MYCKFCGATLAEGSVNCQICGAMSAASDEKSAGTVNLEGAQAKRSALDHSYDKGAKYYTNDNSIMNLEGGNDTITINGSRRNVSMKPVQYTENIGGDGSKFERTGKNNELPKKSSGKTVALTLLFLVVAAGAAAAYFLLLK